MITEDLHKKFDHIHRVILNPAFLKMDALGGEIPFWISTYDPSQEIEVNTEIQNLVKKLQNEGIEPHLINLFTLSIDIIEEHLGLEKMFAVEKRKSKERFKKALESTINIHERLIPTIKGQVDNHSTDLLLINGVGSAFPYIRSHNVLNNLQSAVKEVPTLMFFPGEYTGRSLELFGLLKDDNYYRAFNIDNYKL
ncbi:DUF1788 domain-containing protein [Rhodohalobacter sulfatireducens]|uniref:DUF1788 domain-containing protein n=1 Tax=Rhodohalobacter sulfatireducens TaxID=2911366 RepID=A0ABS9KA95_9BACT|nr:DUF1788 domain-containing protein [Rhodohalobacter sulfatireducens]MCG2587774.1 DUF1788 domain-containing protein [Rhodohalobacter sulfatireducens]